MFIEIDFHFLREPIKFVYVNQSWDKKILNKQ